MAEYTDKILLSQEEGEAYSSVRENMMRFEMMPELAEQLAEFLARKLIAVSDLVQDSDKKTEEIRKFAGMSEESIEIHPIFAQLYRACFSRKNASGKSESFAADVLYEDDAFRLEVERCSEAFIRHAHTVIHGSLTADSVRMGKDEQIRVVRPGKTYYGPIGYDIGTFIAYSLFAWCLGDAMIQDASEKRDFCDWCLDTAADLVDGFVVKYDEIYDLCADEPFAKEPGFKAEYLASIMEHVAAAAGIEAIRQIGTADGVPELNGIADEEKRLAAEQIVILFAKDCIMNRDTYICGADYAAAIERAAAEVKGE